MLLRSAIRGVAKLRHEHHGDKTERAGRSSQKKTGGLNCYQVVKSRDIWKIENMPKKAEEEIGNNFVSFFRKICYFPNIK